MSAFKEVAESWLRDKSSTVKRSTLLAYALTLKTHLIPAFGDMERVEEGDAQKFINDNLARGLSKKTIRDIIAVLKSVAKYGSKRKSFPFEEWELKYPRNEHPSRPKTLSLSEHQTLMRYLVDNMNSRNIGILLSLCTGMRIGEVCALRWEDVDFENRLIRVRHTAEMLYDCSRGNTEEFFSSPKTINSFREIPISKTLLSSLKRVRAKDPSLFVVGNSSAFKKPRAFRDYFNRKLKKLGLPRIPFHGLRHTFATRCIESQCDYKTVSALLGHSNVATTLNLYVHPNIDQKKNAVFRMERALKI